MSGEKDARFKSLLGFANAYNKREGKDEQQVK